jgi:uroporphyrinogen decarboxylase
VRSETPEIAIELSLQPWRAFKTDGVIFFSDILTPLPALGIEFDMIKGKGPVIADPVRSFDRLKSLRTLDDPTRSLPFIQEILSTLRKEVDADTALLGFVGTPWTLAAYAMEGESEKNCQKTKVGGMQQLQRHAWQLQLLVPCPPGRLLPVAWCRRCSATVSTPQ